MFSYPPTPDVLNWLAQGRLADRRLRAIRLWVLLNLLYGEPNLASTLPIPFRYGHLRDRLFAKTHGKSDTDTFTDLSRHCNTNCLCQQPLSKLLENNIPSFVSADWLQRLSELSDLSSAQLEAVLQQRPFATVHRSIRQDLTYLAEMGWLKKQAQGRFLLQTSQHWPIMTASDSQPLKGLTREQLWEVMRSLESISFVQPNLEIIIQTLWEQLNTHPQEKSPQEKISRQSPTEPERRIFIHLDYILSSAMQEQVDTLQEQIGQLWRQIDNCRSDGGIVQFDYGYKAGKVCSISVYPVCLHYARRAKYLSAYGHDPQGNFGWHNYRLDRIISPRLTIRPWNHTDVPEALLAMHKAGNLPTATEVSTAIDEAWGFNFYLPKRLLIMRFSPAFAERYVHQTDRHETFDPIPYKTLPALIQKEIKEPAARDNALKILSQRDPNDVYYRAWIRLGDINILMRLRDWRPNGEVIAPFEARQQMREEAKAELKHYKKIKK